MHRVMERDVAVLEDAHRQDGEEDGQNGAPPLLQLMDELITHESDQTLEGEHDKGTDREGNMEQGLGSFGTEEPNQAVPGDGAQPLHRCGQGNALAEGEPGERELPHSGLGAPGGQIGDGECPETHAKQYRQETRPYSQAKGEGQRAGENPRQLHIGGEPDREVPLGTSVALVLGDRRHPVGFHDEVAAQTGRVPRKTSIGAPCSHVAHLVHRPSCLLPSPALSGAGSTVGAAEAPSQPGPSELPRNKVSLQTEDRLALAATGIELLS